MNYKIQKIEKNNFPEKLQNIDDSPKCIYAIGNIKLLDEKCFGVVGTRKITEYGVKNCEFFTKELVFREIPIVSGLALGTDTVAHKTALKNSGKTIAVLGSGFENIFPKENKNLFEEIIKNNGLVITEYENSMKPLKDNFPKRNRIITAISEGILVIEAAYRSGTSITARNAKVQGKKVFALPGKLDSSVGVGVNRLIKDGAILTTNIEDILVHYPDFKNRKRKELGKNIVIKNNIKEEYKDIFEILKIEKESLENIILKTNMSLKETIKLLMDMQLDGIIKQDETGKFKVI